MELQLYSPISIFNLPFSIFTILNNNLFKYTLFFFIISSFLFSFLFLYIWDQSVNFNPIFYIVSLIFSLIIFNELYLIVFTISFILINKYYFNSLISSKTSSFFVTILYKNLSRLVFNFVKNYNYKKFLAVLYLFLSIVICNLLGILLPTPALMTSLVYALILTLNCFSIFIFLWFTQYFSATKNFVMENIDNKLLKNILLSIETLSFLARFISLPVRLFSNIFAGHILLKLISVFTFIFFSSISTSFVFVIASGFAWILLLIISIFEIAMAFVQAYVLTMLLTSYYSEYL